MNRSVIKKLQFIYIHLTKNLLCILEDTDENLSAYENVIHEIIKQAHDLSIKAIHIEYSHLGIHIFFSWEKELIQVAELGREHRHAFAMKLREISGHDRLEMRKILEGQINTLINNRSITSDIYMFPAVSGYLFLIRLPFCVKQSETA